MAGGMAGGAAAGPPGIALMVASAAFQGFTAMKAANAAARADEENARRAEMGGAYAEDDIRRRERALSGDAIVAESANGVSIGSGSALDLLEQNALSREYEVLSRRYESGTQAAAYRTQARQEKRAGRYAMFGSLFGAGAQAVTGISDMQSAGVLSAASGRLRAAQLPGGQQLPIPAHLNDPASSGGYVPFGSGNWGW
jgi:hypothetical protein